MRVLLLGGRGMLGTDITASAPPGTSIVAPSSAELDVGDAEQVARALDAFAPDVTINAAAYTAVDRAESEPEQSTRVNALAPGLVGRACAARATRVVHFSTDYVFSGDSDVPLREEDATEPVNAYGAAKLAGERALLASGASALIVRTAWLFGANGRSFPRTMWERACARQPTAVVADQFGRPTYTVDLAAAMWRLVSSGAVGIVHATNGGPTATWFDIATRVFEHAGARDLLRSCGTADYPTAARRPRYSTLAIDRLEALAGPMPPWTDAVDRFLGLLDRDPGPGRPGPRLVITDCLRQL